MTHLALITLWCHNTHLQDWLPLKTFSCSYLQQISGHNQCNKQNKSISKDHSALEYLPLKTKKHQGFICSWPHWEKSFCVTASSSFLKFQPCSPLYPQGCWNYHLLGLTLITFHSLLESHLQIATSLSKLLVFTLHVYTTAPPVPALTLDACAAQTAEVQTAPHYFFFRKYTNNITQDTAVAKPED